MRVRTFVVLFAAFLILVCSGAVWSQTVQGVITGTITDPTGAVVPNVTVTITNAGTNVSLTTTSGTDGSYRFPLVPPGTYIVEVKAANFAKVRTSGIVVEASQTVPFSVKLELAKATETIEVTSQAPLVQTATSDLATVVGRETIATASLADRDIFAQLPFLAPQTSPGLDLSPTSGGARESGTSYLLNGSDNNDNFSEGAINIKPPLESVEDFTILTNSMSAQYGRGNGAVVSANQKSGTNGFHGAVYEYNRNSALNAADFFFNRSKLTPTAQKPPYIRNQFGGEVDGPIRKDKTFFAFAYDRYKILAGTTNANVFEPTTAALATLTASGGPIAQQVLAAFPPVTSDLPCAGTPGTGAGFAVGCLPNFFDPRTDTVDTYYGRVDHNFSASDRLSFSANIFREAIVDKFGGGGLTTKGPINSTSTNHYHNLTLGESHVFNPYLVNEVTIAHNRHYSVCSEGTGTDTVPHILIDNVAAGGLSMFQGMGPLEGGQIVGFVQDRWQAQDNLTWTKGRHALKFGGGGQSGIFYRNWDLGNPGEYEFKEFTGTATPASDGTLQANGTISGITAAQSDNSNFQHDYPYFQEMAINPANGAKGNAYRHYTYHDYDVFVQDDWKVTPHLTVNLGLRWDRYGAPSETNGVLAQFTNLNCNILDPTCIANARVGPVSRMWNTQNHDFGPRVGFAWDVFGDGKTAVRGSFGIFYDRIFDNIWSNGAWNPPFYALIDFDATACDGIFYSNPVSIGGAYDPSNPIPHPGKRVSIRTMDVNMKDSSADNFSLGVERQFLGNFLARVSYQGALGRHLPMLQNYNREDGIAYNASLASSRPNHLYTGFNYRANRVNSSYNSLIAEVQKRMGHGLQFQTSYTFSKLLDLQSELFSGCSTIGGLLGTTASYYFISNAQPNLYKGPASYDHKHAYKLNVIYDLPFLRNDKGFAGRVLGGWTLSGFYQLYSGHPMDVFNGNGAITAADAQVTALCPTGCPVLDQNGMPFNIGGDYNLDGVHNDHPNFIGSSLGSVYSGANPADGIFKDNNRIACGFPGLPATVANTSGGSCPTGATSTLFANPAYPSGATPFERFGNLGRGVFHGPRFQSVDASLGKTFKLTERLKLDFRMQAQNLLNHPNFDCVDADANSSTFGRALCLVPFNLGGPISRIMSIGAEIKF